MQLILWKCHHLNSHEAVVAFIYRVVDEFDISEVLSLDFDVAWLKGLLILVDCLVHAVDAGERNLEILI